MRIGIGIGHFLPNQAQTRGTVLGAEHRAGVLKSRTPTLAANEWMTCQPTDFCIRRLTIGLGRQQRASRLRFCRHALRTSPGIGCTATFLSTPRQRMSACKSSDPLLSHTYFRHGMMSSKGRNVTRLVRRPSNEQSQMLSRRLFTRLLGRLLERLLRRLLCSVSARLPRRPRSRMRRGLRRGQGRRLGRRLRTDLHTDGASFRTCH
mmetsp:Transcript_8605/g.14048  ORF Transcript_8605/g.14048 Transcript_8605/m.14048 type:complete len:206 (-) Transcript_8605:798-1415(-)